jgi:hypothetical protein
MGFSVWSFRIADKAVLAAAALLAFTVPGDTAVNPFGLLIGKWGGSGLMTLEGARKVRMTCDALYSGGAAQLTLSINCKGGEEYRIEMRARLSANAGRLMGFWEERYYKVAGSITGTASDNRVNFKVAGAVQGTMDVSYSKSRQTVNITAKGVPMQAVTINLTRR